MSKLFSLKKWLTVKDAAKHLSTVFHENVEESDIYQLALDGQLRLSLHLVNGAYVCPCVPVNLSEIEWDEMPSLDLQRTLRIPKGGRVFQGKESEIFQVKSEVKKVEAGVWDLPMEGGERIDVEHIHQNLTTGIERDAVSLDGVFIASESGDWFEIQSRVDKPTNKLFFDRENFHPAGALPENGVFVIRVDALRELEKSVNGETESKDKPLTTRERDTLLTIIAALAKEAKINIDLTGKAAGYVEGLTAELGARVSKRAIEEHLKKIPNALGTRMK